MIKIGVVGVGHVGKTHFFNLNKFKNVDLVGVADKSKRNQELVKKYGVKNVYSDYVDLFEKEDLDAVTISLPNFLHSDCIKLASEKGIDVMVDKPLARSVDEAKDIIASVNRNNSRLMVSVNFRYFPHVQKIKEKIDSGMIGNVVMATLEHIMNGPWSHPLYPTPTPEWWFDAESVGGGALMDNGYHTLDLFTWLFGKCEVLAAELGFKYNLDVEDSASLIVRSENGTQGVINCGWFSNVIFPQLDFRVIAHGTSGFLNTDNLMPSSLYIHGAKEGFLNFGRRLIGKKLNLLSYTYYFTSYVKILEKFIDCINTGEEFPIKLDQQINVLEAIEKAYALNSG